ncbi:bifunctional 3-(3-hydroxy-phenyl)propionate/3-hydroxycinnamic acid hydroxylase [Bowdeniella massiliensis]|uniref:bifunctional 3-(3-hydroxy-phenyl)propionate/3-hydroxycinnamic acid hydroxylase MhpA n=1 Tax=Bowdeniella massiliensis TaxID=2932264 RepID=UPI0020280802|nr:bifunctional 3-(3-hydroxy-phenyl)propionate/3-hydroxycinnamic acid hydroxylase [Bowdeniella massiliensis]
MAEESNREDVDVLIVGAGPVGLTLANLLGGYGVSVLLAEARSDLIDYPRGVGLDDESYRTIQAMGLIEPVRPHTNPNHIVKIVNGKGRVLTANNPTSEPFGFARKHGFIQPLVDRAFFEGLDRYEHVNVAFEHMLIGLEESGDFVTATLEVGPRDMDGTTGPLPGTSPTTRQVRAKFVVGCEGGRSFTRKWLGATFVGESPSTRWLVVDVENDPVGTPGVYLGADPKRPYVSIGLPHAVRRWEFMLHEDEPSDASEDDAFVHGLLTPHVPDPTSLQVIRRRVFTHHGRVADTFRSGRVIIAGDAAHLMPVWMGQGFNSGLRDATNLAWKIATLTRGQAGLDLLDTYDAERREHAKAMVDLSMTMGNFIKQQDKRVALVRDSVSTALGAVPQIKSYFSEMRFKPMPRYTRGVLVDPNTLAPGRAAPKITRDLIPVATAENCDSPVGVQFIQPRVSVAGQDGPILLDDALGPWWAIAAWGNDPRRHLAPELLDKARELGMRFACIVPETQRPWAEAAYEAADDFVVIGDHTGALKRWYDDRPVSVVFIRPDRFVAAAVLAQEASPAFRSLLAALSSTI